MLPSGLQREGNRLSCSNRHAQCLHLRAYAACAAFFNLGFGGRCSAHGGDGGFQVVQIRHAHLLVCPVLGGVLHILLQIMIENEITCPIRSVLRFFRELLDIFQRSVTVYQDIGESGADNALVLKLFGIVF